MRASRSRRRTQLYVRSETLPVVRLWLLRLLVPLNGQSKFISRHGFQNDDLAESLGMDTSADSPDEEGHNVSALRFQLRERYLAAEAGAHNTTLPEQLSQNIARLGQLVGLTEADRRILEFAVMVQNEPYLDDTSDYLGPLTSTKLYKVLSAVLDLPLSSTCAALGSDGVLTTSGLLSDRFADHVSSKS